MKGIRYNAYLKGDISAMLAPCHGVLFLEALDVTRGEVLKHPYPLQAVQPDQSINQAYGLFSIARVVRVNFASCTRGRQLLRMYYLNNNYTGKTDPEVPICVSTGQ